MARGGGRATTVAVKSCNAGGVVAWGPATRPAGDGEDRRRGRAARAGSGGDEEDRRGWGPRTTGGDRRRGDALPRTGLREEEEREQGVIRFFLLGSNRTAVRTWHRAVAVRPAETFGRRTGAECCPF